MIRGRMRNCPVCGTQVAPDARACPFCKRVVAPTGGGAPLHLLLDPTPGAADALLRPPEAVNRFKERFPLLDRIFRIVDVFDHVELAVKIVFLVLVLGWLAREVDNNTPAKRQEARRAREAARQ